MLLQDVESLLQALQIKQSKYKYDFITELKFNQKTKCTYREYSIIKYHTEVIENKRLKIQDLAVRAKGKLLKIVLYLADELKAVDSS